MRKWIISFAIVFAVLFSLPYLAAISPLKSFCIRILEKKLEAKITADKLRLSWFGPQRLLGVHFQTDQLDGQFQEIDANSPLWAIGRNYTLSHGKIQVIGNSDSIDDIQATIIGAEINAAGTTLAGDEKGKFSIRGTAVNQDRFTLAFNINQMPTAVADWFFKAKGMLISTVGTSFNLKGTASVQDGAGNFDLGISSQNATAALSAAFTPDSLVLQKPLFATFHLTPEMSLALTKNALAVTGQDPIVLKISSNGFFLPRPFSLAKLKINRATLDLGRVRLQNAYYLSGLSVFLKTKRLDTQQVDIWLNETDFSLENGLLELGRVDALLANSIHLSLWGKAQLFKETLDMILGVPADTLSKSFGIRGLSSNYVLQIPMTGTFQKPQFDTGSATAKIGALVAANQLQKKGGILGGVAGVVSQAAQEKAPPAKRPFPWERGTR